ncbi:MAG: MauE/DoxX family redox-associated membrane protein, partial [Candidatus Absconditabacterales bacterium]
LFDLKGFVRSYRKYDIIAKRWHGYAYLFPFLEIVLGLAYLLDANMQYRIAINSGTLLLVAITGIGIFHSLRKKEAIDCVCMGTTFPLPMSNINLWENISMGAMAFFMLLRMGNITLAQTASDITGNNHQTSSITQQTSTGASCH